MSRFQLSGHLVKRLAAEATLNASGTNVPGSASPRPGDATGLGMRDGWRYGDADTCHAASAGSRVPPVDVTAPQGSSIMGTAGPGPCHVVAGTNSAGRRRRLTRSRHEEQPRSLRLREYPPFWRWAGPVG